MSDSKCVEHLYTIAKVKTKIMTLRAIIWTVRHGAAHCLSADNMTRVFGNNGVLIRTSQGMVRNQFDLVVFQAPRWLSCSTTSAHLEIARFPRVYWDATRVECFLSTTNGRPSVLSL